MTVVVTKKGKVVAKSNNLRVILRYQREKSPIKEVRQNKRELTVRYNDGAGVKTIFATESVLSNWVDKKVKKGVFPQPSVLRRSMDYWMENETREGVTKTRHAWAVDDGMATMLNYDDPDSGWRGDHNRSDVVFVDSTLSFQEKQSIRQSLLTKRKKPKAVKRI